MVKFSSKGDVNQECKCTVRLLEDSEVIECEIQAGYKAQHLLDYLCQQLDITEKDYFGLRYVDHHKQRKWLDLSRSVLNQTKGGTKNSQVLLLCFRAKFYPPDPLRLSQSTRYQLFLQLKRDLQHGRLYCPGPGHDLAFLAALCLQEELGDYDPEIHLPGYVSDVPLVLNQTEKFEQQVERFHCGKSGNLPGISPTEAVNLFLRKAATLDTYGIDPHPVKDPRGARLYIGTNHSGVSTFHNGRRTHHFRWTDVSKLNYEGKMFIVHLIIMEDARTKKKHTVGFKCATSSDCRQLWRYSVEQRIFFTFSSSADIPAVVTGGSFFSRGSKVRYRGRVERELSEDFTNSLPNSRSARAREAFTRRTASEPGRDSIDRDQDDDLDEMAAYAQHERHRERSRREDLLNVPRIRAGHISLHEDGSSASASTKTSSQVHDGRDSYDASSCGTGSQDDQSDSASWVALDLRQLSRAGQPINGDTSTLENEYDATIDSDFYGYSSDQSPPVQWHDNDPAHQFELRLNDKYRHDDRSTMPSQLRSSKPQYGAARRGSNCSWLEGRRMPDHSSAATTTTPSGARSHWLWTQLILLICTSLLTVFTVLVLILVIIYETDYHWAIHLRYWPELVFIQRHLYIPLRSILPL